MSRATGGIHECGVRLGWRIGPFVDDAERSLPDLITDPVATSVYDELFAANRRLKLAGLSR